MKNNKRKNGSGSVYYKTDRRHPWIAEAPTTYDDEGNPIRRKIGAFDSKAEAFDALKRYLAGTITVIDDNLTFYQLFKAAMNERTSDKIKRAKDTNAYDDYKFAFNVFTDIHDTKVRYLTPKAINEQWVKAKKNPPTNKVIRSMLNIIFSYAFRNGLTKDYSKDPAIYLGITFKKDDIENPKHKCIKEKDLEILIADDDEKFAFVRDVFRFMIYTGTRINEVLSLEKANIDLNKKVIHITAQNSKTNVPHRVPMHKEIAGLVFRYYHSNANSKYMFTDDPNGEPMSYEHFRNMYWDKWIIEKHGMNYVPHDTRYTFRTNCGLSSMNMDYVESYLGHISLSNIKKLYDDVDTSHPLALLNDIQLLKFHHEFKAIESDENFFQERDNYALE